MNMREAFEAWHKKEYSNTSLEQISFSGGYYRDELVFSRFEGWQAAIAAQAQQSQWISVDERLPKENCHVLVACEGGNVATTFYAIDHSFFDHAHGYKLSRKKHGKYSKHFELARQYSYRITHWMPLPPAPEVDKE